MYYIWHVKNLNRTTGSVSTVVQTSILFVNNFYPKIALETKHSCFPLKNIFVPITLHVTLNTTQVIVAHNAQSLIVHTHEH